MSAQILFNVRPHQTRMAFVKDGVLKDIFYHRDQDPSLMGAVYKGRVSRLAKRLNFAFVELGLKKSGFLYGKDMINRGNQPLKPGPEARGFNSGPGEIGPGPGQGAAAHPGIELFRPLSCVYAHPGQKKRRSPAALPPQRSGTGCLRS